MIKTSDESLKWLRYVLNGGMEIPQVRDWCNVYAFAEKHRIVGICNPTPYDVRMPQDLLFKWIGDLQFIRNQNRLLNERIIEVCTFFNEAGFRCCFLKGQGNALMYPDSGVRCSGDIDVWVDADMDSLYRFVKNRFPNANDCLQHIELPLFQDVEVEAHYTPLRLYHSRHNDLLQDWIEEEKDKQFNHSARLPETEIDIHIPTTCFNAVYQLGHIIRHLIDGGIGLRQVIDYFYVLKQTADAGEAEKKKIVSTWEQLGMKNFAAGVLWIEKELLGIPKECLLVEPNSTAGRLIAETIMEGGNFGMYSNKHRNRTRCRITKGYFDAWWYLQLFRCIPSEATARMKHKIKSTIKVMKTKSLSV